MGRLRLFGELIEAGGAIEGGGQPAAGGGHQIARIVRTAGDYQTSSTSFADIDAANLSISLTTGDSWVYLLLAGSAFVSGFAYLYLDFTIDAERVGAAKGVQEAQLVYAAGVSAAWLAQLGAGNHVFRPQWRVSGGTATFRASAAETPLLFAAIELT